MIETINKLNRISRQMLQDMGREPTPDELAERTEMPIGDDEDTHLGDFIEDTAAESPLDSATVESLRETVHGVLSQLTPRDAKVLRKLRHPSRSEQLRSFLIED